MVVLFLHFNMVKSTEKAGKDVFFRLTLFSFKLFFIFFWGFCGCTGASFFFFFFFRFYRLYRHQLNLENSVGLRVFITNSDLNLSSIIKATCGCPNLI